ncbi:hypothetical protein L202_03195 [Cryptococcus amylolentus CBS 6039]|uniref:BTB domain-containing protein n=2 Tax=Cryptococcus amylolentus TaxID=104669 RepID=A0A1E3HXN9_9TREE|nr:hypothetical protein L202_03195 [Cryptococcus amylolentus CBS 6039]ODN81100.1 hypothetical protein L202_03195 [Cryptococcus amylolentus CBS 6039]ODO09560.1 hypothetical protein I350_03163 [Cryptococcus amylolentus CBS 6273]
MSNTTPSTADETPPSAGDKRPLDDEPDPQSKKIKSKKAKSKKVKTVPAHPDCNDTSNGIRLVSSDDVAFFVPIYILQTGSTVFREMFSLVVVQNPSSQTLSPHPSTTSATQTHSIEMTDTEFETSGTIHIFLNAVQGISLRSYIINDVPITDRVQVIESLLRFAQKWESGPALAAYERVLMDEATKSFWKESCLEPLDIFALAALGDLTDVAALVIRHYHPLSEEQEELFAHQFTQGRWGILDGVDSFHASNMPKKAW